MRLLILCLAVAIFAQTFGDSIRIFGRKPTTRRPEAPTPATAKRNRATTLRLITTTFFLTDDQLQRHCVKVCGTQREHRQSRRWEKVGGKAYCLCPNGTRVEVDPWHFDPRRLPHPDELPNRPIPHGRVFRPPRPLA